MLWKKCARCGKKIIKKSSEGIPYWKTKRFCCIKCSVIGRPSYWKERTNPYMIGNKLRQGLSSWNKGLTAKTDKRVALLGKKSGTSRLNKPKVPYRIFNGYKYIFKPNHPCVCKSIKCVPEQILIMEQYLGRFLNKQETVHHINNNKFDNRIENLKLFPNKSEHMRWHALNDKNSGLKKANYFGHPCWNKKT